MHACHHVDHILIECKVPASCNTILLHHEAEAVMVLADCSQNYLELPCVLTHQTPSLIYLFI